VTRRRPLTEPEIQLVGALAELHYPQAVVAGLVDCSRWTIVDVLARQRAADTMRVISATDRRAGV